MCVKIFTVILIVSLTNNVLADSEGEYMDTVINMLLNGESFEVRESEENGKEQDLVLIGGIWKCGNCADIDDTKLVYSEVNELDADITDEQTVQVQISLSIPFMTCKTVVSERAGTVQRVSGACAGDRVSVTIAASNRFTVNVYAD